MKEKGMMEKYDLERLPKWAQREVKDLERKVQNLERENVGLRLAITGEGGSAFKISAGLGEYITLPTMARHLTWGHQDFELRLGESQDFPGAFEVMGTTHHGITLRPRASNVIIIEKGRP